MDWSCKFSIFFFFLRERGAHLFEFRQDFHVECVDTFEASLKLFAATCVCFKERSSLLRHSNTFMRERQSFSCKRSLAMSELIRALSLSSLFNSLHASLERIVDIVS